MLEDFILPDIGEGIVECELVEWLISEGDLVAEDQPIADVQTDKALVQIPAKHAGRISKLYVHRGELAKVHAPLFQMEIAVDTSLEPGQAVSSPASPSPGPLTSKQSKLAPTEPDTTKVLATPAVRRIAREQAVDMHQVKGTGPKGRILKQDMVAFVDGTPAPVAATAPVPVATATVNAVERIPMKGIRALMAKKMQHSVRTIPHFTYAEEIDVSSLNQLRRTLNEGLAEGQPRLTLMALFIKSLSLALSQYPLLNSHMNEAGDEIAQYADHNIGMAVDSPMGLLVPNIKAVNRLSLLEVAAEVKRLTEAGRAGRLAPADLSGGTITISNIGAIGGTVTTPIINVPEVAIVGIGRIQRLPRPDAQDQLVLREIIVVSWSGDHRVLDGGTIARFNNSWKAWLETPERMLLALR
ncbi:2-oxo acid dehydrogenase subunit E2 [Reinekea sp.]|jgi:2-oxoisovalerate dehydrogenase E2 component (dihydrolipoyl transacylase)|uniref:2-oxo acid dehydrogenase subunit E2 n=1 Tax=Reinekea sp. TaxID=1970455 RepID=UPI002A7FD402|nr:2-oxo acid dehydrogenase subunit E2 [Reinekea sp.]